MTLHNNDTLDSELLAAPSGRISQKSARYSVHHVTLDSDYKADFWEILLNP